MLDSLRVAPLARCGSVMQSGTMSRVEIKVLWTDDDGMLEAGFKIASSIHCTYHETYLYPESLATFAKSLIGFPESTDSEVVLKCGSADPKFRDSLELRAFVSNPGGHSALEVRSIVRGTPPVSAETHFYVPAMPADLNRLGAELSAWLESPTENLVVEWKIA